MRSRGIIEHDADKLREQNPIELNALALEVLLDIRELMGYKDD